MRFIGTDICSLEIGWCGSSQQSWPAALVDAGNTWCPIGTGIQSRAAVFQGMSEGPAKVVRQCLKAGIHHANQIAIHCIGQTTAAAGADQVVAADRRKRALNVVADGVVIAAKVAGDNGVMQCRRCIAVDDHQTTTSGTGVNRAGAIIGDGDIGQARAGAAIDGGAGCQTETATAATGFIARDGAVGHGQGVEIRKAKAAGDTGGITCRLIVGKGTAFNDGAAFNTAKQCAAKGLRAVTINGDIANLQQVRAGNADRASKASQSAGLVIQKAGSLQSDACSEESADGSTGATVSSDFVIRENTVIDLQGGNRITGYVRAVPIDGTTILGGVVVGMANPYGFDAGGEAIVPGRVDCHQLAIGFDACCGARLNNGVLRVAVAVTVAADNAQATAHFEQIAHGVGARLQVQGDDRLINLRDGIGFLDRSTQGTGATALTVGANCSVDSAVDCEGQCISGRR